MSDAVETVPQTQMSNVLMQHYAVIDEGRVTAIEVYPADLVLGRDLLSAQMADKYIAIEADADVKTGDIVKRGKFSRPLPPVPSLDEAKATARAQMIAFADQITGRITGRYPVTEVASWPTQEIEARAVIAGADALTTPLITALAEAAGVSPSAYAAGVLAKAAEYRQVVTSVKMVRDDTEAAIKAATTPEAVATALGQARQTALLKAAELGLA